MRQSVSEYDERDDDFSLVGDERAEADRRADRGLPKILLTVLVMALFAGGLWFAYVQGTRHPAAGQGIASVPLLRADERPSKVKPDQPGGMAIPDQNVSLYNEKPGGPAVERLLPAPEQPLPRPAPKPPAAKEVAAAPPAPAAAEPAAEVAASAVAPPQASAPMPTPPTAQPVATVAAPPAKQPPAPSAAAAEAQAILGHTGAASPIQVRLASVRSPEAARDEWARLKRENADLLGRLSAVAVRTDLGDKGIYYRIEAGPLRDAATAERLCGELKRRRLGCIFAR